MNKYTMYACEFCGKELVLRPSANSMKNLMTTIIALMLIQLLFKGFVK